MSLSDLEISKDALQTAVESGFEHIGRIMEIVAGAGRDITRELGGWATDMFEMREAAARAKADREQGGGGLGAVRTGSDEEDDRL